MNVPESLQREIWPRTIRTMLGSILLPWSYGRMRRRRVDAAIGTFNLAEPLAASVSDIVHRTRLWPDERIDVAHELASHFADGVAAGRSVDELLKDFGDTRAASRLIRRAKVRNRPIWWKSWRWLVRGAAALTLLIIVAYAWLFARFYWGSPNITRNYMAEMNAPILAVPEEQRAWPLYVRAIEELGPVPGPYNGNPAEWPTSPESPDWDQCAKYLKDHEGALALVRRAAAMKTLGYVYSNTVDPSYSRALEKRTPRYKYDPTLEVKVENPVLIGVLLPYLGEMRHMARMLRFDARVAAHEGDRERLVADIEAMLGLVDQAAGGGYMIDTLVACAIGSLAVQSLFEHADQPNPFTPADFARLAHRFAGVAGGRINFNVAFERQFFDDLLQRFFTDNGRGDGHMIAAELSTLYTDFGVATSNPKWLDRTAQPITTAFIPSRAQLTAKLDRRFAQTQRDEALPMWRHDERSDGKFEREIYGVDLKPIFPFDSLLGDEGGRMARSFASRDKFEAMRWAAMTLCALESYRGSHGAYPASLDALIPRYLPRLPLDPFDGKTLRYKLIGEGSAARPLLYSIGADLKADHGTPPARPEDRAKAAEPDRMLWFKGKTEPTPAQAQVKEKERTEGDWIIFPPPPTTP